MRIVITIALTACTATPPFHTLETAETLKAREVSVSVAGGFGGGTNSCCDGGGAARVRLGLGHEQEVGVDASFVTGGNDVIAGGKVAYKRGLSPNVAVVVGAGATHGNDSIGSTVGADVAMIASTRAPGAQLYSSARLAVAVPVHSDVFADGGVDEAAFVALGLALPVDAHTRLFAEAGGIGSIAEIHQNYDTTLPCTTTDTEGFYVAFGPTYAWAR